MKKIKTNINGLFVIKGKAFYDNRGFLREAFKKKIIKKNLIFLIISKSKKNVLRGLHIQKVKNQAKYVSVVKGKIVNVSSIAGRFRGRTSGLHYAYSKSGILGFTRQLAAEVGKWKINVNCLCPSQTMTEMLKKLITPEIEEELNKTIPLGRIALPEEQAKVILFLASDDSSYIQGALIDSNGGQI